MTFLDILFKRNSYIYIYDWGTTSDHITSSDWCSFMKKQAVVRMEEFSSIPVAYMTTSQYSSLINNIHTT